MAAIDTRAVNDAWGHDEHAKSAAQEAEWPAVLAHVSGEQAYTLIEIGRSAEAVEMIRHVHRTHRGQIPALLRAWLSAAEAEAASVVGDKVTCRNALDQAARLLPEHDHPDPELPYLALNRHHLARWRGTTWFGSLTLTPSRICGGRWQGWTGRSTGLRQGCGAIWGTHC
ncbi:hypothetical protein [Herbidospora sp. NBRC 101105]|uniref:hypothetical protein n=1 Tax=Herbidospora sp. NBRC 101105 TaxID=3032195 RepID=UPI002552AA92|nr:hypothetical protein [Herbidospora sp. NBRC 101105]